MSGVCAFSICACVCTCSSAPACAGLQEGLHHTTHSAHPPHHVATQANAHAIACACFNTLVQVWKWRGEWLTRIAVAPRECVEVSLVSTCVRLDLSISRGWCNQTMQCTMNCGYLWSQKFKLWRMYSQLQKPRIQQNGAAHFSLACDDFTPPRTSIELTVTPVCVLRPQQARSQPRWVCHSS